MPRPQWETLEGLTPFAQLIREYMWKQRPPLNVNRLAERTGLRAPTIWKWFRDGVIPDATTLNLLAEKTDIPLMDLYIAAGYLKPEDIESYINRRTDCTNTQSGVR